MILFVVAVIVLGAAVDDDVEAVLDEPRSVVVVERPVSAVDDEVPLDGLPRRGD